VYSSTQDPTWKVTGRPRAHTAESQTSGTRHPSHCHRESLDGLLLGLLQSHCHRESLDGLLLGLLQSLTGVLLYQTCALFGGLHFCILYSWILFAHVYKYRCLHKICICISCGHVGKAGQFSYVFLCLAGHVGKAGQFSYVFLCLRVVCQLVQQV